MLFGELLDKPVAVTFATLRERLLKLAVTICEMARRIWVEAPKT
jgi:hypothetical protein